MRAANLSEAAILGLTELEIALFDPPTPKTLERNMKWIGRPVTDIWPFEILYITKGAFETPFDRRVIGRMGSSITGKSHGGFLYAPRCDHCAILVVKW